MDLGFNPDVELPGGEWKVTYASMFTHLTGSKRNELARGTYGEMIIKMGLLPKGKYADVKLEEV
jgi:hypothetical protein